MIDCLSEIYDDTPIHIASKNDHLSIIQYLIENVDKDNKWHNSKILHYACEKVHLPIVKYFISKGANIEAKDDNDWTLLHYVSYWGRTDIVKFLVSKGAIKNTKNKNGQTPYDLDYNDEIRNILS